MERRNVVVVSAVLVVGDDEKRLIPVRATLKRIVDVINQLLAQRDIVVRMLAVARLRPFRSRKV